MGPAGQCGVMGPAGQCGVMGPAGIMGPVGQCGLGPADQCGVAVQDREIGSTLIHVLRNWLTGIRGTV